MAVMTSKHSTRARTVPILPEEGDTPDDSFRLPDSITETDVELQDLGSLSISAATFRRAMNDDNSSTITIRDNNSSSSGRDSNHNSSLTSRGPSPPPSHLAEPAAFRQLTTRTASGVVTWCFANRDSDRQPEHDPSHHEVALHLAESDEETSVIISIGSTENIDEPAPAYADRQRDTVVSMERAADGPPPPYRHTTYHGPWVLTFDEHLSPPRYSYPRAPGNTAEMGSTLSLYRNPVVQVPDMAHVPLGRARPLLPLAEQRPTVSNTAAPVFVNAVLSLWKRLSGNFKAWAPMLLVLVFILALFATAMATKCFRDLW